MKIAYQNRLSSADENNEQKRKMKQKHGEQNLYGTMELDIFQSRNFLQDSRNLIGSILRNIGVKLQNERLDTTLHCKTLQNLYWSKNQQSKVQATTSVEVMITCNYSEFIAFSEKALLRIILTAVKSQLSSAEDVATKDSKPQQ